MQRRRVCFWRAIRIPNLGMLVLPAGAANSVTPCAAAAGSSTINRHPPDWPAATWACGRSAETRLGYRWPVGISKPFPHWPARSGSSWRIPRSALEFSPSKNPSTDPAPEPVTVAKRAFPEIVRYPARGTSQRCRSGVHGIPRSKGGSPSASIAMRRADPHGATPEARLAVIARQAT
jgi:hypothetical protein